ncbi:type II secretion system F family protein [Georgenia sp. 10Sc9-8]|uniref:Type II secretion system F family protein n=1 Tax=Georgenia halotolerans TaxID=3028317 RepID=A0ABT5U1U3_9MICO|nr:type II secretion system F family protein [Georgenia halotolerans]
MSTALLLALLAVLPAAPWTSARDPAPTRPGQRPVPAGAVDRVLLLDLAGAALHSGASVPGALQALGTAVDLGTTTGRALQHAGRMLLLGAQWSEAWAGGPPHLRTLADCLEPAWTDGTDPLPLLQRAARSIRSDRVRAAQESAARLGVRLVLPLGLCFLPAFVLLGLVPVLLSTGTDLLLG